MSELLKAQPSLEKAVRNDTSNSRRQELLNELRMIASENSDDALNQWCNGQEEVLLRSLRSVGVEEVEPIFDIAVGRGWNFLKDV